MAEIPKKNTDTALTNHMMKQAANQGAGDKGPDVTMSEGNGSDGQNLGPGQLGMGAKFTEEQLCAFMAQSQFSFGSSMDSAGIMSALREGAFNQNVLDAAEKYLGKLNQEGTVQTLQGSPPNDLSTIAAPAGFNVTTDSQFIGSGKGQ